MIKFESSFLPTLALLISLTMPYQATASKSDNSSGAEACRSLIDGKVKLVMSGREGVEDLSKLQKAAKELFEAGGVFDKLGIEKPFQEIRFLPGGDLNILGTINTFPVAHWHPGMQAANGSKRGGLLYEIVISGDTEQISFYRDDNSFEEQFSILLHAAAGHNHFTLASRFPHMRASNRIQESYNLSKLMDQYRIKYGAQEVSDWFQYLLSLIWAQDILNAHYQTPQDLVARHKARDDGSQGAADIPETANILQALVANFGPDIPEWKKDIARRFERLERYVPAAVRTKIMNEGYATLMQFILPKHTSYDTMEDRIHYCCLLSGVTRKDLSNPYWLGLEAWKRIYKRFQDQPDIKSMPDLLSRDKAFIKFAREQVLGVMDDEQFLRFGLDANWLAEQNLAIVEPKKNWDPWSGPQPPDPANENANYPYEIKTRDPKKVIDALILQSKGFQFQFPKVVMESLNHQGTGAIRLAVKDTIGRAVALTKRSVVETLYVMAQLAGKPVSMESTMRIYTKEFAPWFDEEARKRYKEWGVPEEYWPMEVVTADRRVLITVNSKGEVSASEVLRDGNSDPNHWNPPYVGKDPARVELKPMMPEMLATLQRYLDEFIYQQNLGNPDEELDEIKKTGIHQAVDLSIDAAVEGVTTSLQVSIPTLPRALTEYTDLLGRRLQAALKESILSQGRLIRKPTGVSVKALPSIPYFQFDPGAMKQFRARDKTEVMQFAPPQHHHRTRQPNLVFGVKPPAGVLRMATVTPIPGGKGDIVWGPNPDQGGGKGDPDEDGEGTPEEGDDPGGDKDSEDGGDERYVDVSLDAYAEALLEVIELPNLRPKSGLTDHREFETGGRVHRMEGVRVTPAILRNAFRRGYVDQSDSKSEDEEVNTNPIDIIKRGLGLLKRERDWVVRDLEPVPDPDVNAVVFLQMDMSGSMERFKGVVKQALFDLRVMLEKRYKNVKIVYIAFNDKPYVFDDPEKFFRFQPNGGTRYDVAYKKTLELYEQHPEANWDRFVVTAGDLDEGFDQEIKTSFEEMAAGAQFTATLRVNMTPGASSWGAELTKFLKDKSESDDFVGFADIAPPSTYSPLIFRQVFKNKEK